MIGSECVHVYLQTPDQNIFNNIVHVNRSQLEIQPLYCALEVARKCFQTKTLVLFLKLWYSRKTFQVNLRPMRFQLAFVPFPYTCLIK